MQKESDLNILLTLLIILSVVSFARTLIYIGFDNDLFDLGEKIAGFDTEPILQGVALIFAAIRFLIISLVLNKRGIQQDILTYVLFYLLFTIVLRIYYVYLFFKEPKSKAKYLIDKYQDLNAILVFFSTAYILKFIFLG
jgi:hypothetical protein